MDAVRNPTGKYVAPDAVVATNKALADLPG
jgi:hypothetical protein